MVIGCKLSRDHEAYMPTTVPPGEKSSEFMGNNKIVTLVRPDPDRLNGPEHNPFPSLPYPYWTSLAAVVRTAVVAAGTVVVVVLVLAIHSAFAVLEHYHSNPVPVRTSALVLEPFAVVLDSSVGTD